MGPIKTYGPTVLDAIEASNVNKVTDILTSKFRDKQKTRQFLISKVQHPQSESVGIPLLAAASLDDPSILRFLVNDYDVDVNFIHESGSDKTWKYQTALTVAVMRGCCAMADAILSLGGDINAQDHRGRTPLFLAVLRTDRRMVRLLLGRGAQVGIANSEGKLPLHLATVYGHRELVGLLVSHGGDLYQCSPPSEGMTAIHLAAREGHATLVRMFGELYQADGNIVVQCDGTRTLAPIHMAATEANPDSIHVLIEYCAANPNLEDSEGNTAMHCALLSRCNAALGTPTEDDLVECLRVLISHGANVNSVNAFRETPLHMAARNGLPKAVELLVESGCDPAISDNDGNQAIDLLMSDDEVSRRLIMDAMEQSKNGPQIGKPQKKSRGEAENSQPNVQQKTESGLKPPNLQTWLKEHEHLIEVTETVANGRPFAQSTTSISRNLPSSKESMESITNDSDGDAIEQNQHAKMKPPPPPKPNKKVKADATSRNNGHPAPRATDRDLARHLDNSKDVQNIVLQRRDSQHSLTGVAQLDVTANSLTYESGSVKVLPSQPAANNWLNMSFDSAQKKTNSKENRPIPKSRDMRSKKISESGSYTQLPGETLPTVQSQPINSSSSALPLPAQRKSVTGRNKQQSSVKTNTLVFERATESVSPAKDVGKTLGDVADGRRRSSKSKPPPAMISGANLSNSFEAIHRVEKAAISEHATSRILNKQQDRTAAVKKSESEEEEEDSSDGSEVTEEEEDEDVQNMTQASKASLNTSINQKNSVNREVRVVTFDNCGNLGFRIVGGNSEGIFVHSIDRSSNAATRGLANGDQILRANNQRILGRTKEEADKILKLFGGQLTLHVRSMPEQYRVVVDNGGIGDGLFVQAQFSGDGVKKGELSIHEGDIFSVTDTLPENNPGFWKAHKVNTKKNEEQFGTIPNKQKADQISVKHRLSQKKSETDQRGGTFFKGFPRRSISAERNSRNQDEDEKSLPKSSLGAISYKRMVQRLSENRRPVVVLGLFCDAVIGMLIRDAPELFEAPQEEVESFKSTEEPVNVGLIHGVCHHGRHCLIILTPPSIEYLLQKTDLNPIVVYISPVSKSVVKTVKAKLAPNYNKSGGYMYDEAVKFEKTYGHLFSTSVAYTTDDWWFFHLKEAIGHCQNQPIWFTITEEEVEASNEAELKRICPKVAIVPSNQIRASRDKTRRMLGTTDDFPLHYQNGGRVKQLPPIPPSSGSREPHVRKGEGTDVRKEKSDGSTKPVSKQRQTGGRESSGQASILNGTVKGMSMSFEQQEAPDILHHNTGKASNTKPKIAIPMGRETLL